MCISPAVHNVHTVICNLMLMSPLDNVKIYFITDLNFLQAFGIHIFGNTLKRGEGRLVAQRILVRSNIAIIMKPLPPDTPILGLPHLNFSVLGASGQSCSARLTPSFYIPQNTHLLLEVPRNSG